MLRTNYYGNPFIGVFLNVNDEIILAPLDTSDKLKRELEEELKAEIIKISIANSNLIGIYSTMNNSGILLPSLIEEEEVEIIKKTGINIYISKEKHNAHGNNLAVNDKVGIVNPNLKKEEIKNMEDVLGVELIARKIGPYSSVGSVCVLTNSGFLCHYGIDEEEVKELEATLNLKGKRGSINNGVGFVSLGIVCNKKGYVVGSESTGFEIGGVAEALNYI